jgi:Family of unknown function (DUF5304)
MSDATEPDADAWAAACAEDLAAEKARRREKYGPPPGSAGDELRRLADTVAEKIAGFAGPLAGIAGQATGRSAADSAENIARQLFEEARSAVEPVVGRNPEVFHHLAAAGSELLAAYRAAVEKQEKHWTMRKEGDDGDESSGPERIDLD